MIKRYSTIECEHEVNRVTHNFYYYFQILNTMFEHNVGHDAVIDAISISEILLQNSHFVTNIKAVTFFESQNMYFRCTLKMTNCSFTVKNTDLAAKIIHTWGKIALVWELWKTSFQTDKYQIFSKDRNFTNSIKIISGGNKLFWSISETPYASGKNGSKSTMKFQDENFIALKNKALFYYITVMLFRRVSS